MGHYRTLPINGTDWRFNVGKDNVDGGCPDKKIKFVLSKSTFNADAVSKLTAAELEADPKLVDVVTPAQVESYIRRTYPDSI